MWKPSTCLLLVTSLLVGCGDTDNSSTSSITEEDRLPSTAPEPIPGSYWPAPPGIGITQTDYRPLALSAKVFRSGQATYAPVNILEETVGFEFDVARSQTRGQARIKFRQEADSQPIFLFEGSIQSITFNGEDTSFARVRTPDGSNSAVAVQRNMKAGETAEVVISFTLSSDRTTYSSGGVAFLTSMADLVSRFVQRYWPTGFEDDGHAVTLRLKVVGGTAEHNLYANGQTRQVSANEWEVVFPSYYSLSSFFVHLTNKAYWVDRFKIQGLTREIPITVYSTSSSLVQSAKARLPALFREMEADYGPYSHPEFVAYIVTTSGGMEHVGATVTHLDSLPHELLHSWFARGVIPAEGRSGWIDEAIADWRGKGYPRATSLLKRSPTSLATSSPFAISTPMNSYQDGRLLMSELDLFFADIGGMKPLLKAFMDHYRYSHYTTEEFRAFIEAKSGRSIAAFFNRYVFGKSRGWYGPMSTEADEAPDHPRPFTDEEIEAIR